MTFKIEMTEKKAQPVLSIRTRTAFENLPNTIGESYTKIMQYLTEIGEEPADAPFTAYYNMDMKDLDVELGFPVQKVLSEKDEIQLREVPAGKYVSCIYKGPYAGMEQPYNKMFKWISDNGYEQKGVYYEYYYNSPQDVPESELLTKIEIPLK
ncbi:MAG: GyrI-like domain-containing protein [Clostridia bacterium]|nr:GyrI-like domain-containing protein [Clostridia bacterium]